jgi:phage FluMu protein Com
MGGIIIEGVADAWGVDAWETKCPRCKGSGTIKTESTMNND